MSGGTMLQVFPRDHEAIKAHLPHVKFTVRDTGVDKFLENLRTGRPQTFTSQELASITSDFDVLMPSERSGMTLNLMASSSTEAIPLRLIFGKGDQAVTYDYVPFRRARSGSEEILFESTAKLPFRISLLINTNGTSNVSFAVCSHGDLSLERGTQNPRA
jgi:hypothetical protein